MNRMGDFMNRMKPIRFIKSQIVNVAIHRPIPPKLTQIYNTSHKVMDEEDATGTIVEVKWKHG